MANVITMKELHEFVKNSIDEILKDEQLDGDTKAVILVGAAVLKIFMENQIRQSVALEQIVECLKPQVMPNGQEA